MTDFSTPSPAEFRPSRAARTAAIGLAILSVLTLVAVLLAARHTVRTTYPRPVALVTPTGPGPKVKAYDPLQDEVRTRLRQASWPAVLSVVVAAFAYLVVIGIGMAWIARDADRRKMRSGTWVMLFLVCQLLFASAALGFLMFPAAPWYALPLLPPGWVGLAIYLLLRRPGALGACGPRVITSSTNRAARSRAVPD